MNRKAFVLLSGGLDSTTVLAMALADETWTAGVEAVSINYGQRHAKEMLYAKRSCDLYGINHTILDMPALLAGSMLTDPSIEIPKIKYEDIEGVSPTYVPFRNGLMLSMLTAHAQKWVNESADKLVPLREAGIYFGAHAEDAQNWAYPDCTPEFIGAMAGAIYIGSYRAIRLFTPIMWMQKWEIVKTGDRLAVPFQHTWSCYAGGEFHCGECPTCHARQAAFKIARVQDPTRYANGLNLKASLADKR